MESGNIDDFQIAATSFWNYEHAPYYGRLESTASWMADVSDTPDPHLVVDFRVLAMLVGIKTQGDFENNTFLTSFKIALKTGGEEASFNPYQENGAEKVRILWQQKAKQVRY